MNFVVVGSGPSGFYAAEALLRADPTFRVDLLDRLPTPFGLVRGGVAPDHPKIKQVSVTYDRIAQNSRLRFFGNVRVGRDVSISELRELYHAVVLATGAEVDSGLGIPGEDLPGSHGAAEFVGWYNGHPDHSHRQFDLSHETAVVIGHGNVAADICRMLTIPVERLESTDTPEYALEALRRSRIRHVYIIGRRGPMQARFTNVELRELGEIPGCQTIVDASDLELNEASRAELADSRGEIAAKNLALFRSFVVDVETKAERFCHLRFLYTPLSLAGTGRVERIILARNRLVGPPFQQRAEPTSDTMELPCGAVFRSIGFRGVSIPGVPFDASRGIVPNCKGRVIDAGATTAGLYVTGWIKRGASGVIGTNRADSVETAKCVLEDLARLSGAERLGGMALIHVLAERGVRAVRYEDWRIIDRLEQRRGTVKGKQREKLSSIPEMLDILDSLQVIQQ